MKVKSKSYLNLNIMCMLYMYCLQYLYMGMYTLQLHLDVGKWEENPDKQILQWGGINVEHQYSRDSGF